MPLFSFFRGGPMTNLKESLEKKQITPLQYIRKLRDKQDHIILE